MRNIPRLESHDGDSNQEIIFSPRQTLQIPGAYGPPGMITASVSEPDDITSLMQHLQMLWRHKWLLLLATVLGCLAGLGVSLWSTPTYLASTSLEIQDVQEPFGRAIISTDPTLATQAQLLLSGAMRERAFAKLNAHTATTVPEVSEPLAPLRGLLGLPDPLKSVAWSDALGWAAGSTMVTPGQGTRILSIQSESPNPQAAADFANTLAREYIASTQEGRWESYQNTGEWLSRAQEELKAKVEESDRQLAEFARASGLNIVSSQNISEEKLRQLQAELARAGADRIIKQSVYESSLSSPTESLPEVLDSGPMGQYQVQISDLRRQLAEQSTTLTPAHYRIQRLQAQIDELENARERERKNIITRIRIDYEGAQKRESQLQRDFNTQAQFLSGQSEELIQYNILLREAETNKKLYESTLTQGKEASLALAMRANSARVIDAARVPGIPRSPNLPLNLSLGTMGGLFCGAVFVFVRSRVDASIQAPGMLGAQLNLRELGVIPSATAELRAMTRLLPRVIGRRRAKGLSTSILVSRDEAGQPGECLELVTWTQNASVISEAFRSAMTSILFSSGNANRPQVLVITSPAPQEGKTTVASNLAIALAEINHRVLLIDADMRLPRLHSIFDLPNTFGLSDVLSERRPVEEYVEEALVRKTHIPNLYIMPAGPARSNLSRLLYSGRMKELVSRFRGTFDTVLIDSAPVLSVPDARILAHAADGVVLVVRAHTTHQSSAFAAARFFEEDGQQVLGTILNDWNPRHSATYGQYGSYGPYGTTHRPYGPDGGSELQHIPGEERP